MKLHEHLACITISVDLLWLVVFYVPAWLDRYAILYKV